MAQKGRLAQSTSRIARNRAGTANVNTRTLALLVRKTFVLACREADQNSMQWRRQLSI
jgi:hypothetical protein